MTRISQQECRDILEFRKGHKNGTITTIMLYSVINTKLRDFYSSLEVLCEDMGLSEEELKEKLSSAGFEYDKDRNQFI